MSDQRSIVLHMRVSDTERARMEACASREGLALTPWIRRLALLEVRRAEGAEARRESPGDPR